MGLRQTGLIRRTHRYWHLAFFALVLAGLFVLIKGLSSVLTPVMSALIISYFLDPIVNWLERKFGFARWLGTLLLFVGAVLIIVTLILVVAPIVVREIYTFAQAAPGYIERIGEELVPWVERTFRVKMPQNISELFERMGGGLQGAASSVLGPLGGMASTVARGTAGLLSWIGTLLLIPVFTFYFLPKFPNIIKAAEGLIPLRFRDWVRSTACEIDRVLAAWLRGQFTVMAALAIIYSVGLSIVGIKMAVLIGLLTGLFAFIPYVGFAIGVFFAVLVCLLEYQGIGQLVGVGIVFAIGQTLDGLVLTPFLVGERVGIGPVGVLIALMLGGSLFGYVGVLLAVPTAAALVVVVRRALEAYRESHFFKSGGTQV